MTSMDVFNRYDINCINYKSLFAGQIVMLSHRV